MLAATRRLEVLVRHATSGHPHRLFGAASLFTSAAGSPILEAVRHHPPERVAVVDDETGAEHSYFELLSMSSRVAFGLRAADVFSGPSHVAMQWGVWRGGGAAVPLCTSHPFAELRHVVEDSAAACVCSTREFQDRATAVAHACGVPFIPIEQLLSQEAGEGTFPDEPVTPDTDAIVVYTSGTTGLPKGVPTTHGALLAQVTDLVHAWRYGPDDHILHFLPLHHVHGIVNKLACVLYAGGRVSFCAFEPRRVWQRLAQNATTAGGGGGGGGGSPPPLTLFMAVPTIYARLLEAAAGMTREERQACSLGAQSLRLMVSGSAALPEPIMHQWAELTGHTLLERYGMTEFGMALSNPLRPEAARVPGCVGLPLPSVHVRIVCEDTGKEAAHDQPGELRVKGPGVFKGYLRRAGAGEAPLEGVFDEDGWFRTGDTAVFDSAVGAYRILGRTSVDIIKTGGYKVSALEVERVLLAHPQIAEAVVVGLDDPVWGQRVAALIRVAEPSAAGATAAAVAAAASLDAAAIRAWAKQRIAAYKAPSVVEFVTAVPKNAMGKVNKKALVERASRERGGCGAFSRVVMQYLAPRL